MKQHVKILALVTALTFPLIGTAMVGDFSQLSEATIVHRTFGLSMAEQENPLPFRAYVDERGKRIWLRGTGLPAIGFDDQLLYADHEIDGFNYATDANNVYILVDANIAHDTSWDNPTLLKSLLNGGAEKLKLYTPVKLTSGTRDEKWTDYNEGFDVLRVPKSLLAEKNLKVEGKKDPAYWALFSTLSHSVNVPHTSYRIPAGNIEGGGWTRVLVQKGWLSTYYFYPAGAVTPDHVLVDEIHPQPLNVYQAKDRTLYVSSDAPISLFLVKYNVVDADDLDTVVLGAQGADLMPKGFFVNQAKEYYSFYKQGFTDARPGYKEIDFGNDVYAYTYAKIDFAPWLVSTDPVNHKIVIDVLKSPVA